MSPRQYNIGARRVFVEGCACTDSGAVRAMNAPAATAACPGAPPLTCYYVTCTGECAKVCCWSCPCCCFQVVLCDTLQGNTQRCLHLDLGTKQQPAVTAAAAAATALVKHLYSGALHAGQTKNLACCLHQGVSGQHCSPFQGQPFQGQPPSRVKATVTPVRARGTPCCVQ